MRNLRKLLAVVLAVTVVLSVMATAVFADTAISADATTCKTLGMLVGSGADGVTAAYTATQPTRAQAAIMLLRLKGLEKDALAFTGTDNFSDVTNAYWKPITAYLKAHPELGFAGVGDNKFDPDSTITAQQYYKVVLTGLGYKVKADANDTTGDFLYSDTITFAASKGLTKVATASPFTVDNLAVATVEGLKATVKGGTKTLAQTLGDANADFKAKATTAGLITAAPALTVSSVSSITNTRLEVVFSADASSVAAADLTVATGTTPVAVNSLALRTDKTHVFVNTAAMTAGSSYDVSYKGTKVATIVSKPADTTAATPKSVLAVTPKAVRVIFDSASGVDTDTLVAGNFSIKDSAGNALAISSAALDTDYNSDKTNNANGDIAVLIGTAAQASGTLYTLTVNNVADTAGNKITANSTYNFAGAQADTTAPAVSYALASGKGYVDVVFTEATQLDAASAGNAANYTINGLTVTGATVISNVLGGVGATPFKVRLAIKEAMTNGAFYTLSVSNVADIMGNKITTATANFAGVAKDTSLLKVTSALATNNTTVSVTFNKTVGDGALVAANYTIAGLTISAAAYDTTSANYDSTAKMGDVITLTTSAQTSGTLYKLTAASLKDDLGNLLDTTNNTANFAGAAVDTVAPQVASASATAAYTVKVLFDKKVDKTTATNVLNYSIDNSLGYPSSAVIDSSDASGKTVVLTVADMTPATLYKVTVTGVKDTSGNVVSSSNNTATFPGLASSAVVKVSTIVSLNKEQIQVVFNQPIALSTSAAFLGQIQVARTDADPAAGDITGVGTKGTYYAFNGAYAAVQSDNKTVIITFPSTVAVSTNALYSVQLLSGMTGKYGASADTTDKWAFAANTLARPDITIVNALASDLTHVTLTFSEKVAVTPASGVVTFVQDDVTTNVVNASAIALDPNDSTKVNVTLSNGLTPNKVYRVHIATAANIKDVSGNYSVKTDVTSGTTAQGYVTTSGLSNPTKVNVSTAAQTESDLITVTFDRNIAPIAANVLTSVYNADVAITTSDGTAITNMGILGIQTSSSKPNTLKIYTTKDLIGSPSGVYKVSFSNANALETAIQDANVSAANLAVSGATTSAVFAKAISDSSPSISSVAAIDGTTIKIVLSESVNPTAVLDNTDFIVKDSSNALLTAAVSTSATSTVNTAAGTPVNTLYLRISGTTLNQGSTYTVELTADGTGHAIVDLNGNKLKGSAVVDKTVAGIQAN